MMDKLPPIEKIYEAYSAIADGRAVLKKDHGEVFSSDWTKCYTIIFDGNIYSSDDNSTYWQGYAGYPVIAILFLQEKLPFHPETADLFAGIDWHELNKRFKRDYQAAAASIMEERQLDRQSIETETKEVHDALKKLDIVIRRGKKRPVR